MKMLAGLPIAAMILAIIPVEATPQPLKSGETAAATVGTASGTLSLLRIHDVGTGFGPAGDFLDAEVIIRFNGDPTKAYGFQLRDDANRPVREGMLELLRDAYDKNWTVTVNYYAETGRNNSVLFRVWVSR